MFYVLYYGPMQFIVMTNSKGNCIVLLCISHHFIFVFHLTQIFSTWIHGGQACYQLISFLAWSYLLLTIFSVFSPVTVDVIKTRYLSDSKRIYNSPMSCIAATYREAGVQGFFKVSLCLVFSRSPHPYSASSISRSSSIILILTHASHRWTIGVDACLLATRTPHSSIFITDRAYPIVYGAQTYLGSIYHTVLSLLLIKHIRSYMRHSCI